MRPTMTSLVIFLKLKNMRLYNARIHRIFYENQFIKICIGYKKKKKYYDINLAHKSQLFRSLTKIILYIK